MKLLNIDKMETLESEEYKLKEIDKFEANNVGAIVIKPYSYYANKEDPLEELEEDYKKFMQLPHVIRMVSNDKSLQLFGYINSERYKSMRSVFLKTDIKDADPIRDINILYTPHSLTESNNDNIITNQPLSSYSTGAGISVSTVNEHTVDDISINNNITLLYIHFFELLLFCYYYFIIFIVVTNSSSK